MGGKTHNSISRRFQVAIYTVVHGESEYPNKNIQILKGNCKKHVFQCLENSKIKSDFSLQLDEFQ